MFRSRKCTNHEASSRRATQSETSAGASHTEQIAAHMPWPGAFPSTWQAHAAHGVFGQLERFAMWACAQCCPGLAVHDTPTQLSPATRPRCQFGSSDTPPAPRVADGGSSGPTAGFTTPASLIARRPRCAGPRSCKRRTWLAERKLTTMLDMHALKCHVSAC